MPVPRLTADEIVSTLSRSNLPNIVVEGKDDFIVYRWLEAKIKIKNVNVLPCSGRDVLLEVYKKRNEFSRTKVVFVADKDVWLYSGTPEEYSEIIWTTGYSLENDVYAGSILEELLDEDEAEQHRRLIAEVCKWYSFEIGKYLSGGNAEVAHSLYQVCPPDRNMLCETFMATIGYREPSEQTLKEITEDYQLKLRGKQLFEALLRFLSHKDRASKYSKTNLLELGAKTENAYLKCKIESIEAALTAT